MKAKKWLLILIIPALILDVYLISILIDYHGSKEQERLVSAEVTEKENEETSVNRKRPEVIEEVSEEQHKEYTTIEYSSAQETMVYLNETLPNTNVIAGSLDLFSLPDDTIVDLKAVLPNISVELLNNSEKRWHYDANGKPVYSEPDLYSTALLRAGTAKKIAKANEYLIRNYGLRLRIIEAYRSYAMQGLLREHYQIMNNLPDMNFSGKFVAYPGKSRHQRGVAVDVVLEDVITKKIKEMPSKYLTLDEKSHSDINLYSGKVRENLIILHEAMNYSNMESYPYEWWHFNDVDFKNTMAPVDIDPDTYLEEN